MADYTPPVADIDWTLNQIVGLDDVSKLDGFQHLDQDTIRGLISEAGRFYAEVIAPLNRIGDQQGSVLQPDGTVKTPDGFKEAYAKYVEAGWAGAHIPEEYGGGGLPYTVGIVLQEMFKSANMAFSLCPLLTQAAIESLIAHGSDEQRAVYLDKLVTGEWTGTMCLTEPEAGSDVGALRTKAIRQEDGTYRITGTKIFITWGEHDMAENIIHLVLARTPDAPPGTKGISMFIVPKYLPDEHGNPGQRNDVKVVSLEHKLGIHASPTCVLAFGDEGEGAVGYLIGEEQRGMKYMFTMMNTARLGVGIEGLAIGEAAFQKALAYAQERRQGRAIGAPATESSVIVEHPDVRRMLLTIKAYVEAMRGLLYTTAKEVDLSRHADTEEERTRAAEIVALLTPVAKAWCTDRGVDLASLDIQVHGGMGYIEETGAPQYFRDSRIAPIYEGTNGIQAIDLVLRKLPMREGQVVKDLFAAIGKTAADLATFEEFERFHRELAAGLEALTEASRWLADKLAAGDYNDVLAGATPYLEMFGTVSGGWIMAKSALAARRMLDAGEGDEAYLRARLTTAHFYGEQILPRAAGLLPAVTAGAAILYEADPAVLGA